MQRLFAMFAAMLIGLALQPAAGHAQAACDGAKAAARQEWQAKDGPGGDSGFESGMAELVDLMKSSPAWNNAAELRKDQATGPGISPGIDAYLQCLVRARADELEGKSGASAGGSQASASPAAESPAPSSGYSRADCDLVQGSSSTGTLSTESSSLTNKCPVRVGYVYCLTGKNDGGQFSCNAQKFGTGWISAGGTDYISVAGTSPPFTAHWGYCLATPNNDRPLAVHPHWNGKEIDFDCR